MKEKILAFIKAFLTAKGIDVTTHEAALNEEVEKFVKDNPGDNIDLSKLDLSKFTNNDNAKLLSALIEQTNSLKSEMKSVLDLVKADADAKKADKDKADADAKTQLEKDVKAAVDNVILVKKAFPEAQRERLTKLATLDLPGFKELYSVAEPAKEFKENKQESSQETKTILRSTAGNATALEAIQKHQSAVNGGVTT